MQDDIELSVTEEEAEAKFSILFEYGDRIVTLMSMSKFRLEGGRESCMEPFPVSRRSDSVVPEQPGRPGTAVKLAKLRMMGLMEC